MARTANHTVVEIWKVKGEDVRYHVTANDRILRSTGPRGGKAKILMTDGQKFRVGIVGPEFRRATIEEFRPTMEKRAELEWAPER